MLDQDWTRIAGISDVEDGEAIALEANGRILALYHVDGENVMAALP